MVTVWLGARASTVVPKTIWVRGVSLIWLRGSSDGSLERRKRTRPSRGLEDFAAGKEMVMDCVWAEAAVRQSAAERIDRAAVMWRMDWSIAGEPSLIRGKLVGGKGYVGLYFGHSAV
jgi:hypothetical protein